jgi:hypothetical protein
LYLKEYINDARSHERKIPYLNPVLCTIVLRQANCSCQEKFILPPTGRNFVQVERTSFQCESPTNVPLTTHRSKSSMITLPSYFRILFSPAACTGLHFCLCSRVSHLSLRSAIQHVTVLFLRPHHNYHNYAVSLLILLYSGDSQSVSHPWLYCQRFRPSLHWTPFVRHSGYNKPKVKLRLSSLQIEQANDSIKSHAQDTTAQKRNILLIKDTEPETEF